MRFQVLILLLVVTLLVGCASAATKTKARSIHVNLDHVPIKRILRSDATTHAIDGEERAGWSDGLTKMFKLNPKIIAKLESGNPELAKLAKKHDLAGAFKSLKLHTVNNKNVDKLFTSKKFDLWISYMIHWNSQSRHEPFSVAKMFNQQLGSQKAFQTFDVAAMSSNTKVAEMGKTYQVQLFKQFYKADNTPEQISTLLGGDAAAAKMFTTVIQTSGKSDKELGLAFANVMLTKWAAEDKTVKQVTEIAPSFSGAYVNLLKKINPQIGHGAAAAAARV